MAYQPKSYRKFLAGTISAAVVASAVAPAAFAADVKLTDVAGLDAESQTAIAALVNLGIIKGYPTGEFKPNQQITRGQTAEMLVAALPTVEPKTTGLGSKFSDLSANSYYAKYAEAIADAGIVNGAAGKFEAGKNLTREQMAKIIVNAMGLKNNGKTVEIKDLDKAAADQREFITILAQHEITIAPGGNFDPKGQVTRNQFSLFVYRALTLAGVIAAAPEVVEVKSVNSTTLQVKVKGALKEVKASDFTFDNGLTVSAAKIVPAAAAEVFTTVELTTSTQEAGKTYKLLTFLGKEVKADVKVEVAASASVVGLTATNLKEVTVNFNTALDATSGANKDNYTVTGTTVETVTLSVDKKSATLTLGAALKQQGSVEVTAKKALKFVNGTALTADTTKKLENVTDVTIPVAEAIKLTGPNKFEVTFSEPVQSTTDSTVLINNGIYGVASKELSTDGRTLTVTLSASTLAEATYSVKVSGYKDFADFGAMSKTFDLVYAKDATVPTVELKTASQTEVKVTFSKPVTQKGGAALTKDYFYHTYSAWKPYTVTTTDNKTFTLSFDDNNSATVDPILPEGDITVTVLKTAGEKAIVDLWGNELAADAKLVAKISSDKVAPTVTKVEAKAENQLVVTFSEDVKVPTAANYVIKDAKGNKISQAVSVGSYDSTKYTQEINLGGKLAGGEYTIEVKDVTDKALASNKITPVTLSFTVTDKTAPTVATTDSSVKVVDNATAKEQYIYVTFSEAIATTGANSALSKDNYLVGGEALKSSDSIEIFGTDNKRVKITVKYRGDAPAAVVTAGSTKLTVGRIADVAGNVGTALSTDYTINSDSAPTAFTVAATDLNKLQLVFNAELKTVTADGIQVNNGADSTFNTVAAIDKVEVKDGKTYVDVTVKADERLADKGATTLSNMKVSVVANKLETITGQKLAAINNVTPTDKVAPALTGDIRLARTDADTATITLTLDEALKADLNTGLLATDFVITDATGKAYTPAIGYILTYTGATVTFTLNFDSEAALDKLNDTKFSVATKAEVNYLVDAEGNKVKAFTYKETKEALANN